MRIAIATDRQVVSAHFGRCQTYTIVDIEAGKIIGKSEISNPGHEPGAIPQFLNEKGVNKIVCGGIGARATDLFAQMGIQMITGVNGTMEDTIGKLTDGTLVCGESMCTPGEGRGYGVEKTECDHAHE